MRLAVTTFTILVLCAGPAAADIYKYTDKNGVVHYTNIKPRRGAKHRWKRVGDFTPKAGKPSARRGSCKWCDKVPARDSSAERYKRYDKFIYEAATLYKIPAALIRAVIEAESDYDPRVVSSTNARGLMQLMPSVIKDMGVRNVHDPRENILGGTRLLRVLANRYNGDLVLTVAAYHAGMGSVARYRNNVPPYVNTRNYLRKVVRLYYRYKRNERNRGR